MLTILKTQPEEKEVNLIGFDLEDYGRLWTKSLEKRDRFASRGRISTNLKSNTVFPIMATQMLAIRDVAGIARTMPRMIAEFDQGEVKESVNHLSNLMDPLAVLGIIVGSLFITKHIPIFMMGAVVKHGA